MVNWAVRAAGKHAVRHAVTRGRRPLIDIGTGLALMRDRRVPAHRKALALFMGIAVILALIVFEIPYEGLVALFLNVPGVGLDMVVDGLEVVAGPILLAAVFLTRLAPPAVVDQVRLERAERRLLRYIGGENRMPLAAFGFLASC